jgi:hypothetical protein
VGKGFEMADAKNNWHLILGTILKELLKPTGITVELEVEVMTEPPRADILLLRRETKHWTPEQLKYLPDGIRDTNASHILLEFKYTESITVDALLQTASNHRLYLQSYKDEIIELKSFIISSKQPQAKTLEKLGFTEYKAGIYHSDNCFIDAIPLISLNTLANTERNAWLRCLASKKQEQKKAFDYLNRIDLKKFPRPLYLTIIGLRDVLFGRPKVDTDNLLLEPEEIMRLGKFWEKSWEKGYLESLSTEKLLENLSPEERLQGLKPEERLRGLTPEQIEAYLKKIKR